jgi:hypothetical protein
MQRRHIDVIVIAIMSIALIAACGGADHQTSVNSAGASSQPASPAGSANTSSGATSSSAGSQTLSSQPHHVWTIQPAGLSSESPIAIGATLVYTVTSSQSGAKYDTLMAISRTDGSVAWRAPLPSSPYAGGLALADGLLICVLNSGVFAIDPVAGTTRWQVDFTGNHQDTTIFAAGSSVLVLTTNSYPAQAPSTGWLAEALNPATGRVIWQKPDYRATGVVGDNTFLAYRDALQDRLLVNNATGAEVKREEVSLSQRNASDNIFTVADAPEVSTDHTSVSGTAATGGRWAYAAAGKIKAAASEPDGAVALLEVAKADGCSLAGLNSASGHLIWTTDALPCGSAPYDQLFASNDFAVLFMGASLAGYSE